MSWSSSLQSQLLDLLADIPALVVASGWDVLHASQLPQTDDAPVARDIVAEPSDRGDALVMPQLP